MKCRLLFIYLLLFISFPAFSQINIDYWTVQAKSKLFRKEYLAAIEDFNTILNYKPDLDEIVFFRGLAKYYLSDQHGAIDDFTKALSMHPYGSNLYYSFFLYRGMAKEKLDDTAGALIDYNNAIDAWPYSPDEFISRGFLLIKLQRYEDATADFKKVLELDKKNPYAFVYLGLIEQLQKKYGEALNYYSKALNLDRNNVEAYIRRGITHNYLKGYEKAMEDFNKAIQLDTLCTFAYFNRANAKTGLEDLKGAIMDYDRVIALDPENDLTYFNRADLKTKEKDIQGAIADYTKAIEINPGNVLSYFNRAFLYDQMGSHRKAIEDYTSILKINPLYSNAYHNRSIAKYAIHDLVGGKADQNMANQLNANLPKLIEKGAVDSLSFSKMTEFKTGFKENTKEDKKAKSATISFLPDFYITYSKTDSLPWNKSIQHATLQRLNKSLSGDFKFHLSSQSDTLIKDSINYYAYQISLINNESDIMQVLFAKAILDYRLQKKVEAKNDLDFLIRDYPSLSLAYFNRAKLKHELLTERMTQIQSNQKINYQPNSLIIKKEGLNKEEYKAASEEILLDYTKCSLIDPDFAYAFYNRATIHLEFKNYFDAYQDLSKAIAIDPKFGEAYYNRGLTLILVHKQEEGCQDLSEAGKFGIKEAYTTIKKFCDR